MECAKNVTAARPALLSLSKHQPRRAIANRGLRVLARKPDHACAGEGCPAGMRAKTKPAPEGAGEGRQSKTVSGAGVQHRDRAAVLRPAGDVVAHRDRALLAIGDGAHPVRVDAAGSQEGAYRL